MQGRKQLRAIVLILDCRHKPTEDDITMYKWIKYYNYRAVIVATKIDKVSRGKLNSNLKIIRNALNLKTQDKILTFSALNKAGRKEILDTLDSIVDVTSENQ